MTSIASPGLLLAESPSHEGALLGALLVILATAAIIATLFRRLKLEAIPGYLVAGAIVGPHALGLVPDLPAVEQISQLAIILLMFGIGLTLETSAVNRGMLSILSVGAVSTLHVALAAWPVGTLFGLSAPVALVCAMAISMSSTAVLIRVLQQRREVRQVHGRLCIGVAIAQDMAAVLFLAVLPPIAHWAGAGLSGPVADLHESTSAPGWVRLVSAGAFAFGGMVAMLGAGRFFLPRVMAFVARTEARSGNATGELIFVLSAAIAIGSAILTTFLGFSPEMGAFLAGLMLSLTPFRHQLSGQFAPLRDLLMAIFFTSVGLRINPEAIVNDAGAIVAVLALVIVGKTVIIGFTAWAFGAPPGVSTLTGVYLANAGEFSLVLLAAAKAAGIVSADTMAVITAAIVLSLILSPLLVGPSHALAARVAGLPRARWIKGSALTEPHEPGHSGDGEHKLAGCGKVIIAGYGPVGRAIADRFAVIGIPFTIIELNPATLSRQVRRGIPAIYGDVTNPDVLESAGVREAEALLLTIPDAEAVVRACQVARRLSAEIFIGARTSYLSQAVMAREAGADHVVVEEVATAVAMEREILERLEARRAKARAAQAAAAEAAPVSP